MNIRAKFDGGKQYNRSQRGAWEGRCAGAGLRYNDGPEWGTIAWKRATGKEANSVFKTVSKSNAQQVEKSRKRKVREEVKRKRRDTKYGRTNDDSLQARSDYARHDGGPEVHEVHQDVPADFLQGMMMDYYQANVYVAASKSLELESATRNQGAAEEIALNLWMAERRKRITASSCGQIAKRRSTTKVANLVKTLLYTSFRGNTATQWGHEQEPETQRIYLLQKRSVSPDISICKSGFVIHPVHHWLGASPDGLVNDPTSADPEGVVEYKNPYSIRMLALQDAASKGKDFCLVQKEGSFQLKRSHLYFYQIQGTMFCTGRKWCDFVLRTEVDLHIERINFDSDFWSAAMHRLRSFYFSAVLPELAVPRLRKGGIREPSEWLHDPESWKRLTENL